MFTLYTDKDSIKENCFKIIVIGMKHSQGLLFAIRIKTCDASNTEGLWNKIKDDVSENFPHPAPLGYHDIVVTANKFIILH